MMERRTNAARAMVSAAAAGIVSGLGCASKPPVTEDGQPGETPPSAAAPVDVVLAPATAAPSAELTAVARPDPPPPDPRLERACCKGKNECKGKGMCKTERHDCKGLNECKGLGGCKPTDC
jgi:hypothetical protein